MLSLVVDLAESSPACDAAELASEIAQLLASGSSSPDNSSSNDDTAEPKDPCLSAAHLKELRACREAKKVEKGRVRTVYLSKRGGR